MLQIVSVIGVWLLSLALVGYASADVALERFTLRLMKVAVLCTPDSSKSSKEFKMRQTDVTAGPFTYRCVNAEKRVYETLPHVPNVVEPTPADELRAKIQMHKGLQYTM